MRDSFFESRIPRLMDPLPILRSHTLSAKGTGISQTPLSEPPFTTPSVWRKSQCVKPHHAAALALLADNDGAATSHCGRLSRCAGNC
jgi:hypothetical protein